jgi:hypothetical protein
VKTIEWFSISVILPISFKLIFISKIISNQQIKKHIQLSKQTSVTIQQIKKIYSIIVAKLQFQFNIFAPLQIKELNITKLNF